MTIKKETTPKAQSESELWVPHDDAIESALLGAMLSFRSGLETAFELGTERQYFYNPDHVMVFDAISKSFKEELPVDPMSISGKFAGTPDHGRIIGKIGEMIRSTGSDSQVIRYVPMLRDMYIRRELIEAMKKATDDAVNISVTTGDLIARLHACVDSAMNQSAPEAIPDASRVLEDCLTAMRRVKFETGLMNIPTGIKELDEATCGWAPTDMIVLAARPSDGKTALALHFAMTAVREGKKVAIFSVEMAKELVGYRILSSASGINGLRLRSEEMLTDDEWGILEEVVKAEKFKRLFLDDTPALSTAAFTAKARKLRKALGVDLIIVDYLQLMRSSEANRNSIREQDVAYISKTMKATAKSLGIPVIALAQLSRNAENRNDGPKLSDLRESGSIEQDADVVILMSRDKDPIFGDEDNRVRVLHIAKNRNGKAADKIRLSFDGATMRFGPEETPAEKIIDIKF